MKTIFDHIEHVKKKPHHIRKRVAFGAALSGTAVIALVWLVGSLSMGTFALKQTSFADTMGEGALTVANDSSPSSEQGVAGVGAAAISENANTPRIEIIDAASTTSSKKTEPTTIPF